MALKLCRFVFARLSLPLSLWQELSRFVSLPQSSVQGFQHERGLHGRAYGLTVHSVAEKFDPDCQMPLASCSGEDAGVTGPVTIEG